MTIMPGEGSRPRDRRALNATCARAAQGTVENDQERACGAAGARRFQRDLKKREPLQIEGRKAAQFTFGTGTPGRS